LGTGTGSALVAVQLFFDIFKGFPDTTDYRCPMKPFFIEIQNF
jgi:hypothetical protein